MDDIVKEFGKYEQTHVFGNFDDLDEDGKENLLQQSKSFDMKKVVDIFRVSTTPSSVHSEVLPPSSESIVQLTEIEEVQFFEKGLKLIKRGEIGVVLLSGGQGTRLGYDKPKGMFPHLKLPSNKTLFELQANRIQRLQTISGGLINWYIMVSKSSVEDVREYFEKNKYFDLKKDQIHFFVQSMLPCFTESGKIIMEEPGKIAMAPNGNGDVYSSLAKHGMIQHMKENGVKFIHLYAVDNVLAKVGDPAFVAKCVDMKADFGSKVIDKKSPHEKVGVFGKRNGKYHVIEYSEITKEQAEMRKKNKPDELMFNESNICQFFYTLEFISKCSTLELNKYHVSKKDVPSFDGEKKKVTVKGIKLEMYNFDICQFAENVVLFKGKREEDFSPLKNKSGGPYCTPEDCRKDLFKYHRSLLAKNGAMIPEKKEGVCEISPLVTYMGEGLQEIVNGKEMKFPIFLRTKIGEA